MVKKAILLVPLLVVIGLVGCAYNPPIYNAGNPTENNKKTILDISYNDAWKKSLQVLATSGYNIKTTNKQDGIIATDKKLVRLDESQVDCGNIWGLPYAKDTRTATSASISLLLQAKGEKTSLTVNSQIEGLFNATAVSTSKQLSCYSLGYLEKDVIDKISH